MQRTLKIVSKHRNQSDLEFWLSKSYAERIEAIEFLRDQLLKFKNVNKRLQRVCTITRKA
jgi:hypothetical protein